MLGWLCCAKHSFACLEVFSSSSCFAVLQAPKTYNVLRDGYLRNEAESRDECCVIVHEMSYE